MDDFLSGLIRLLFKLIVLVAVVYLGFVVVTLIWNDMNNRFLSDDEEETEVVESAGESVDEDDMPMLEPESMPAPAPKKSTAKKKNNGPATIFDAPRECVTSRPLKVVDIFDSRYVIAKELHPGLEEYGATTDLTVVFIDENNEYYTDQVIKIPSGKCARQIGVYKSTHFMYDDKTLPIVEIMNK